MNIIVLQVPFEPIRRRIHRIAFCYWMTLFGTRFLTVVFDTTLENVRIHVNTKEILYSCEARLVCHLTFLQYVVLIVELVV